MMALHVWALSHGIASLFGRGDAASRRLPMTPEELLEAGVLLYLRGLGLDQPASLASAKPSSYWRPRRLDRRAAPLLAM